ncbi:uncharacterized protein LOC116620858 isoform X1 [Nematostella vectensis]|uniref:uncharacterized protein LOC116620858 isoform X1 n=1 Tax=Nematostella vectensis TaxID=45351 RepID=UPI0020774344|nr:uncharacterized protein LOC116620858 isoform X1 [Nematostella vectensis]
MSTNSSQSPKAMSIRRIQMRRNDTGSLSRESSFSSTELSVSRNSSFSSFSSRATSSSEGCCETEDSSVSRSSSTATSSSKKANGLLLSLGTTLKHPEGHHKSSKISILREQLRNSQRSNDYEDMTNTQNKGEVNKSSNLSLQDFVVTANRISSALQHETYVAARQRSKSDCSHREIVKTEDTKFFVGLQDTLWQPDLSYSLANNQNARPLSMENSSQRIAELEKQVHLLIKERHNIRRELEQTRCDRGRMRLERDALKKERDILRRDKEELHQELYNRSNVIRHLQEHLTMALIPVPPTITLDALKLTTNHPLTAGQKQRLRSKSETRVPEFYLPRDKNNSYTFL